MNESARSVGSAGRRVALRMHTAVGALHALDPHESSDSHALATLRTERGWGVRGNSSAFDLIPASHAFGRLFDMAASV